MQSAGSNRSPQPCSRTLRHLGISLEKPPPPISASRRADPFTGRPPIDAQDLAGDVPAWATSGTRWRRRRIRRSRRPRGCASPAPPLKSAPYRRAWAWVISVSSHPGATPTARRGRVPGRALDQGVEPRLGSGVGHDRRLGPLRRDGRDRAEHRVPGRDAGAAERRREQGRRDEVGAVEALDLLHAEAAHRLDDLNARAVHEPVRSPRSATAACSTPPDRREVGDVGRDRGAAERLQLRRPVRPPGEGGDPRPAREQRSATARPMPLLAPTTRTCLPCSDTIGSGLSFAPARRSGRRWSPPRRSAADPPQGPACRRAP